MNTKDLIAQTRRIWERLRSSSDEFELTGRYAEATEFLRIFAGPTSSFYKDMISYSGYVWNLRQLHSLAIIDSFAAHVDAGLHSALTPERQAQLDVVSDYLQQAADLLSLQGVHPAAPAVVVGASLEEFLRNWVDAAGLPLGSLKPGIDTYAKLLREADLITKQDFKDITSWAGARNHAAHGEWAEVGDKAKIHLMLEGVNLFIRKYAP